MVENKAAPPPPPQKPEITSQLQVLLTLIALLRSARHKRKISELEFLIVNQTFNLVPYRSCVYWEWSGEEATIKTASGLVQIDPHGPYILWLRRVVKEALANQKAMPPSDKKEDIRSFATAHTVVPGDLSAETAADWERWAAPHAMLFEFRDENDVIFGGVWMDRDSPFGTLDKAFLEDAVDAYAHVMHNLSRTAPGKRLRGWRKSIFSPSKSNVRLFMIGLFLVMLIPVRMSVSAPAEITARDPYMISVPFDGIIEKVEVVPGQVVKKGDILVRMDSMMLKNKSEMAAREMETAVIAFSKTEREAFSDRAKLADINILKSQVEQKSAEKQFADELLQKADIKAERDGVVIFSDTNALRGKPVQTGEQIMLLADPDDSELLIRIPVDAMIQINKDVPASFFLNVSPLGFNGAIYESIGYQASPDPDGGLTYKVRARFEGDGPRPRIGSTGTGKVYGDRTIMAFNILRRPLVTLRRKLGI